MDFDKNGGDNKDRKLAKGGARDTRGNRDNRANPLHPNKSAYWQSRGQDKRPRDKKNAPAT